MSLISRGPAPTAETSPVMGEVLGKQIKNCSYADWERKVIECPDEDYAKYRDRAINHNGPYGVFPMTEQEQKEERDYNWAMVAKFTKSIFTMNFTQFSFPVFYSEPRSFLERTADLFTFLAQKYIPQANAATDSNERLLNIATGIAAGFHLYMACKKPWNPVLGETYVGTYENGAKIYGEQTSHHPPVSDFEIIGPNDEWYCHGHCKFTIASGMREVDINQTGIFHLKLKDGTEYQWEFPMIQVWGIVYGDRIIGIKGPVEIKEFKDGKETGLVCKLDTSSKKNTVITATITQNGSAVPAKLDGDYCKEIKQGDKVLWDIKQTIVKRPLGDANEDELLLSDCRFRIDRSLLIQKNLDEADKGKVIIEESQRREEKLRVCIPAPQ